MISAVAVAPSARADDDNPLVVVGTSDVYDNQLIQAVIKPGFEAAYKAQTGKTIDLMYNSQGTGAAIDYAESGAADALIVHAAALEKDFVGNGYSAEPYGRAVFYGQYVLLGPKGDPAHVLDTSGQPSHDIATAFEKIAQAGAKGEAKFVARGKNPGTTVQEHAIWGLTHHASDPTQDVTTLCQVVKANFGGGYSPSTATGDCSDPISTPAWYQVTGATQGPNIQAADACNKPAGDDSKTDDCYTFTDRGTFQYLRSQPNGISQLQIVASDNASDARGGSSELINSFHAYAVNPDAKGFEGNPNIHINSAGAKAFLDYLTSPAAQTAVNGYLAKDPEGPPFLRSAAPSVSYTAPVSSVHIGRPAIIKGQLSNVVPGTPPLANQPVTLYSQPLTPAGSPYVRVATTSTTSTGAFEFVDKPSEHRRYRLSTGQLTQVENATLSPAFADLLAPTFVDVPTVRVIASAVNIRATNDKKNHVTVTGAVAPRSVGNLGYATVQVQSGTNPAFRTAATVHLPAGATTFTIGATLAKGTYVYRVTYSVPGYTDPAVTANATIRVN